MSNRKSERGSALIIATVIVVVVAGLSAAFISLSYNASTMAFRDQNREKAFYTAEAGIALALMELNKPLAIVSGTAGDGNCTGTFNDGTYTCVTTVNGDQRTIVSTATIGTFPNSMTQKIEVVAENPKVPATIPGAAALVTLGPLSLSGNITIDGRDYDINNVLLTPNGNPGEPGYGTLGIAGGGTITGGGSSAVGGHGTSPQGAFTGGTVSQNTAWATDGLDNDRDGLIDEAGEGYPSDPDNALGLAPGALKSAAQGAGTYFATKAAYDAWLAAAPQNGSIPGGKIIYCEFDAEGDPPFEIGAVMNTTPSIFIIHTTAQTGGVKNVHGQFKGLFMADKVDHVNAGTDIVGMMHIWGQGFANVFGNGNSSLHFSSQTLAALPSIPIPGSTYIMKSWRQVLK